MARKCTVCQHTDRKTIDEALVSGMPIRDVAGQFSLSRSAVHSHRQKHLVSELRHAAERAAENGKDNADSLLEQVRADFAALRGMAQRAEKDGKPGLAATLYRAAKPYAELIGQATGELEPQAAKPATLPPLIIKRADPPPAPPNQNHDDASAD